MQSSPPPVPRRPNGISNGQPRDHARTPSLTDSDDHQPVLREPRTPAEYALHAVFTRFVLSADHKVALYLKMRLVSDVAF